MDVISALPLAFTYYALATVPGERAFLIASIALSQAASSGIKRLTNLHPTIHALTRRPASGVFCDLLSQQPYKPDLPGWPSGHMSVTAAFLCALTWLRWRASGYHDFIDFARRHIWFVALNVSVLLAMAVSRVVKRCHTIAQVIAGTVLGGLVFYGLKQNQPRRFLLGVGGTG